MISEQDKDRAINTIKDLQFRKGRRGSRIHFEAMDDNVQRLRALEGICGSCVFANVRFFHMDGKDRVNLDCQKGLSPIQMYHRTKLGDIPTCQSFLHK